MDLLTHLEAARGGPFRIRHRSAILNLPDPSDLPFEHVFYVLSTESVPGTPIDIPYWLVGEVFQRWSAHYDLPTLQHAQRLAYLLDRYGRQLAYDLRAHLQVDVGEMWRSRRWKTLLDYIDHLPRWAHYHEAVSNDEEHAEMLAKAIAESPDGDQTGTTGPPLSTWTPEVEVLTGLRNDVRQLHYIIPASQGDKKVKPTPALPVPTTAIERARKRGDFARRQTAHQKLAARLLPHKYGQEDELER